MKKLLLLSALFIMLISCNNESGEPTLQQNALVDVTFDFEQLGEKFSQDKSVAAKWDYGTKNDGTKQDYPTCTEDAGEYVSVTIDGQKYDVQFTSLGSQTEVLQLQANSPNIISELIVYNAKGEEIYEMPQVGSKEVEEGGLTGVPYDLDLQGFTKSKVNVDVVCWNDYSYQVLTWQWYQITYYQINTLCFFGDVCTKFYEEFHAGESVYAGQQYDGYDFPAIFTVNIYKDGNLVSKKSNADWKGVGAPLCIEYLDNPLIDEDFEYEIVFVSLNDVEEVLYRGDFEDGDKNFGGQDGLLNFTVGNCDSNGNNDVEFAFPAVLPLPESISFKLTGPLYSNGYANLEVTGVTGNYALTNGVYAGWCGAKNDLISLGKVYTAKIYSSLGGDVLPERYSAYNLEALNWIVNNSDGYTNQQIQNAIWYITDAYGAGNSLSTQALLQTGYKPKVGDWAVVLIDADEEEGVKSDLQLFIVRVDP